MPSIYTRIEATGVHVLDTVTRQVTTALLDDLDLYKAMQTSIYILSPFTALSNYNDGEGSPSLMKNRCDVTCSYILDKSQVPWPDDSIRNNTAYGLRNVDKNRHIPLLIDSDIGVSIEQVNVPCGINLAFALTFQTYDEATLAFTSIQSKYKGSSSVRPFDIVYAYPVSMTMMSFLMALYQRRSGYATKDFMDYVNDMRVADIGFNIRKSQLTAEKPDREMVVRCTQIRQVGQLTMDQQEIDAERVNQLADGFMINFNFQFQFGRPEYVAMHSPISVENHLLPEVFFSQVDRPKTFDPHTGGVFSDLLMNDFAKSVYGHYPWRHQVIRVPDYDDWNVTDRQYLGYEYRPFLIHHFTLDGDVTTIDLKALGNIALHENVLTMFKAMGSEILEFGGLFHVGIYADNVRLDPEIVSIDDELVLTIHSSRPDKVYHLVLSETTNLKVTDPKWDPFLIKYRYFFPMTLMRNMEYLYRQKTFSVRYDNELLGFISKLHRRRKLKDRLDAMIQAGDDTQELYSYTQTYQQLADYMAATQSKNTNFTLPDADSEDAGDQRVLLYYAQAASVDGRSLLVAFLEQCIRANDLTLDELPGEYIYPNPILYPNYHGGGGAYGINTPIRVFNFNIRT